MNSCPSEPFISEQVRERQILGELQSINIPPRPEVLSSIEQQMYSDSPNYGILEHLIIHDVAIAAGLLKLANSAFYGRTRNVRTIKEALYLLGLRTTGMAVAALSLRRAFANVPNLERFWDSSARTAQLSGWVATQIEAGQRWVRSEEIYTFTLFRDCGIPALGLMFDDYLSILDVLNNDSNASFTSTEEKMLGLEINHALIGRQLAEEWRLPIEFQAAIRHHHDVSAVRGIWSHQIPDLSRYLIAVAQLSEHLYQQLTGLAKTCEWTKLGPACLSLLGIAEEDVNELVHDAKANGILDSAGV